MTKEGWDKTTRIISAMASIATLGQALITSESIAIIISSTSSVNAIDNSFENNNKEGLIEQNINNPEAKKVVKNTKRIINAASAIDGLSQPLKTLKSPALITSTILDTKEMIEEAKDIIKEEKK